jgi:CheY-like chemotaxis protein
LIPRSKKKSILVVEDELDVQLFVSNLLVSNGYESLRAKDSAEGLEIARRIRPDLIIMDPMLPDNGGIGLFQLLKQDRNLKKVPVVFMSKLNRKMFCHYQRCMGVKEILEPAAFLGRPPEVEDLLGVIRQFL